MIDVHIQGGDGHLAELIASTLPGHPLQDPTSSAAHAGRFVREAQEDEEVRRPSREEIKTVNFALIEDETDFSEV